MRKLKQRILSLLLVVSMVIGLAPVNVMQVQAETEKDNLHQADGIIWLTKNKDSVSDEFSKMVQEQLKLDDMVRESLGIKDSNTKVYFDGVDVGNAMELFLNMDKIEGMVEEMKDAISNKEFVVFNIGKKDSNPKKVAFRSLEGVTISVGEGNKIYVSHPGAPASADDLKGMIEAALNNAAVSVTHSGTVTTTGVYESNKTRFEASKFQTEGGVSYKNLLKKWPSVSASPDSNERKAGELYVTIKAAEYSQYPQSKFAKTEVVEVIMRDQRVSANAVAMDKAGNYVQDEVLSAFSKEYPDTGAAPAEVPVLKYYNFKEWAKVSDDYDWTAIMVAKNDLNGDGLADELKKVAEYEVRYYVEGKLYHSEKVKENGTPVGPEKNPVHSAGDEMKFTGWEAEMNNVKVKWPAKVTANIDYAATWEKIEVNPDVPVVPVEFTVTGTLVYDGRSGAPQELTAFPLSTGTKEYQIVDPGWESLAGNGYKCTGWYYIDGAGKKQPFDMSKGVWDATDDAELELFYEFIRVVEVTNKNGTTEEVEVVGNTKVYNYAIETSEGTEYITCLSDDLADGNPFELNVGEYGYSYSDRLYNFKGWKITQNEDVEGEYIVSADKERVQNEIGVDTDIEIFMPTIVKDNNTATYTITMGEDVYTSNVEFDFGEGEGDKHTFAVDEETEILITPFHNEKKGDDLYYVVGLTAYYKGTPYPVAISGYDEGHNAYFEDVYKAIGKTRSTDNLTGVELVPEYAPVRFSASGKLPAGKAKAVYTEEYVFNQVLGNKVSPSYNKDAVTIQYKAQEDSYTVNLYKLFELLEKDGLGALKGIVGDQYDSFEVYPANMEDTWKFIEEIYDEEVSAQEAADAYITAEYDAYVANPDTDIFEFIGNVVAGLGDAVYSTAHHKFGYVDPAKAEGTEHLKIEYNSDAIGVSLDATVKLNDTRTATTVTASNSTCKYGEVEETIAKIVKLNGAAIDTGLLITYDADKKVRDFSDASAGTTYTIYAGFKGDENRKPAMSNAFTLTVEPKDAKVTVKPLLTEIRGNEYYNDAKATVTGDAPIIQIDAPIIQIVAGIASDELAYGLNTEGAVKDWSLGFKEENLKVDAWVKLPQSFIKLLETLELEDLKSVSDKFDGIEGVPNKIVPGAYYEIEDLMEALEKADAAAADEIKAIFNEIPEIVADRLGISDLKYSLRVRVDALEDLVYPTEPGFYVNYAATLAQLGTRIKKELDNNYAKSEDCGFIVISPMIPVPNRGKVQLYDGNVSNHQNVFVYEYDGNDTPRKLEVSVDGKKLDKEAPFYYGLSTRLDTTTTAPTKPGVYFAGYNYFTEEENKDSGEMEIRRLGSDSAIIIIKQREVNLTITGGNYEEAEGVNHIPTIEITDKNGNKVTDKGVTIISGTVNVNGEDANVSADDFYGTVNVDLPDELQKKWDEYSGKYLGHKAPDKIEPGDLITFLNKCGEEAEKAANTALAEVEALAMKEAVNAALAKLGVSSDDVVDETDKLQSMLESKKERYDELVKQLEPLNNLNNNVYLTFYDLEKDADKLAYDKTGYYLYMGVITDPDLTVDMAKGMVVIYSEEDYIMLDTHVPYDGEPQKFIYRDDTKRGDISVMVDRTAKEITFFLDSDAYGVINGVLENVLGVGEKLNEGTDGTVATIYKKSEKIADKLAAAIVDHIEEKAISKIEGKYPLGGAQLTEALEKAEGKVNKLTKTVSERLQELDKLPNDTTIIVYNKANADDVQGMPVNAGTYEFYGYDYDVAATRGKLIIEPIYIMVEDGVVEGNNVGLEKYENQDDPNLYDYVEVKYYSYEGVNVENKTWDVTLPKGVSLDDVVKYEVTRTEANNHVVGTYDMSVEATLLDNSGNYELDKERVEDKGDFKVLSETGTIGFGTWKMDLDSVVYLHYYPVIEGFSEDFDFTDKDRTGVVIWTGDEAPTSREQIMVGKPNTTVIKGWKVNDKGEPFIRTHEIYAKNLGDMVYIRPYFVKYDGSYVYLGGAPAYSPKLFSYDIMNASGEPDGKQNVCAALLQYGASAQVYFGYDIENLVTDIPDKLTNVKWEEYADTMKFDAEYIDELNIDEHVQALAQTLGTGANEFNRDPAGVKYCDSVIDLAGAIRLSTGFTFGSKIKEEEIAKAEVLYWNERDFADIANLAYENHNYNYSTELTKAPTDNSDDKKIVYIGDYRAQSDHIVAKYLGETVYFTCRVEMKDGKVYYSGLGVYSPEAFAGDHIKESTGQVVEVSKRIIVYSEMAERWFIGNK